MRIGLALCLLALMSFVPIIQGHDVDLPSCNEAQLKEAVALFPDYYDLIEAGAAMEVSAATVVDYSESLFAWRDRLWQLTPDCEEAFHAGELMDVTASFFVGAFALELAGAPLYTDPYVESASAAQTEQELQDLLSDAPPVRDAASEAYILPLCSDTELDILKTILAEFFALEAAVAHLEWREDVDANPPACAENLEIFWIVYRAVGAFFTGHTLELVGLPREDNSHIQLVIGLDERLNKKTSVITHSFADAVIDSIDDDEEEEADESEAAPAPERSLPACETKQLGMGFFNAFVEYSELVERVDAVADVGDVLEFFDAEIAWTKKYFDALPTCAEALEATLLMHRILADYSSSFALLVAGVEFDDIPYVDVIYRSESLLNDWLQEFTQ